MFIAVCRSQRELLKVLSRVDNKTTRRESKESTRRSTAWTDETEAHEPISESVSYTSLTDGISSKSVTGLRNSRSAGSLKNKPSDSSDAKRHQPNAVTGIKQSLPPAGSFIHPQNHSTKTGVRDATKQSRSIQRPITVDFELMSNWGHERLVGLTEIELLDASGRRIDIRPSSDASVSAAPSSVKQIDALFNGKCKV